MNSRLLLACLACFWVVSLAASKAEWSTFGNVAQHTGAAPVTLGTVTPAELWTQKMNANVSGVSVGGGRVFVNSGVSGQGISALNALSGEVIWQRSIAPNATYNTPSYHDGKLLFQRGNHSSDSQLWCVDAATSDTLWSSPYLSQFNSHEAPTVADGKVWVNGGSFGGMYGYSLADGDELFFHSLEQVDGWTPTYYNGKVYSWLKGKLREHDPATGERLRELFIISGNQSLTCAIDGGIAFAMTNNSLFAIDLSTFTKIWQQDGLSNITPAVSAGKVFATIGKEVRAYDSVTGVLQQTYTGTNSLRTWQPIITQDKVIASANGETYIFDRSSGALQHTIPAGGELALANNVLYIAANDGTINAWSLIPNDGSLDFAPVASADTYKAYQDQTLTVPEAAGVVTNDYDLEGAYIESTLVTDPQHGTVTLALDGSFVYIPTAGYHGPDSFTYKVSDGVHDSIPATVSLDVVDTSLPYIVINMTQDGEAIHEGQSVSGVVEGSITVHNASGQHAQFYKNFRVIHADQHGHVIDSNTWTRTFTLDTSEFYDGENLISVHAHPHNHHGMAYQTEFHVGLFKIVAANANPAPNGDTQLPEMAIDSSGLSVTTSGLVRLNASRGTFEILDDGGSIDFDQRSSSSLGGQAIVHLGASVLGRRRWGGTNPPFGDLQLIHGVHLLPFQQATEKVAKMVIFFNDEVGRANYAFQEVTIPAISTEDRAINPLPMMNAKILNAGQGDTIIVPDDGVYDLEIQVTGAGAAIRSTFSSLFVWVGNRSVAEADLNPYFNQLAPGETSFTLTIPIPASQIKILQDARAPGQDTSAFALWLDFSTGSVSSTNLPTSEHVHLDSIRTESHPWSFGPPTIRLLTPESELATIDHAELDFHYDGDLPDNTKVMWQLDGGIATEHAGTPNTVNRLVTSTLTRGTHTIKIFIADQAGVALNDTTAILTVDVEIVNDPPRPFLDGYAIKTGEVLTVDVAQGVLTNDIDLENDDLTAVLDVDVEHGTLTLNTNGSFTYIPDTGFIGLDNFRYKANDGFDDSVSSLVLIRVDPASQSGISSGEWNTFGNGVQHTGAAAVTLGTVTPAELWTQKMNTNVRGVSVGGGRVFVNSGVSSQGISALHALSGEVLWQRSIAPNASYNTPTYHDGKLLFQRGNQASDSQLWCVDAATSETLWSSPFAMQFGSYEAPTVADGKVWINGGSFGGMYGYSLADGEELFFHSLEQHDGWTPTYYNDKIYSWVDANLREHNPTTGERLREIDLAQSWNGYTSLTCSIDGGLAFAMKNNSLFAIDLNSFSKVWQQDGLTNTTPATSAGQVFVPKGNEVRAYDSLTGVLQQTYIAPNSFIAWQPVITHDKVIASTSGETYIFDRNSGVLQHTIPAGGELALAYSVLYIAANDGTVHAWSLLPLDGSLNFAPVAFSDTFTAYQDQTLTVPEAAGVMNNDYDLEGADIEATLVTGALNGTVVLALDGSFVYTPTAGYHGTDSFTYKVSDGVHDSSVATVSLDIVDTSLPYIVTTMTQNGELIYEGQSVSGVVEGSITVYNASGQHAQFYKNFRTMHTHEHGHMIDSSSWTRTFTLDTSEFYDGENLISVHAHPHNHPGMVYKTIFHVGLYKILTANSNPAPNGDTKLPEMEIDPSGISVNTFGLATLKTTRNTFRLRDDGGDIEFDQSSGQSLGGQAIVHLGASVLGRRRWGSQTPPFADLQLIDGVHLLPFQEATEKVAKMVIFFNDEVGRANYAFQEVTIPAISTEDRAANPMATLDAKILNASQGDTIIIPDDGVFDLEIEVTGADAAIRSTFDTLFVWVGNRSVAGANLKPYFDQLVAGETTFTLTIPIPAAEIKRLENARAPGQDTTAFALWLDFSTGAIESRNLPTSGHLHLDSIRTESRPWTFGPATIRLLSEQSELITVGHAEIDFLYEGDLPDNTKVMWQLDGGSATEFAGTPNTVNRLVVSPLARGTHAITLFLADQAGVALNDTTAMLTVEVEIVNDPPKPSLDGYTMKTGEVLSVGVAQGILSNDIDLEGDPLTAVLDVDVENGTLTLNTDGSFTYIPDAGFIGLDRFRYKANDGFDDSVSSLVLIRVAPTSQAGMISGEWNTFGNGVQHTGATPVTLGTFLPSELWKRKLWDNPLNRVAVGGGRVYVTPFTHGNDPKVLALNALSGDVVWEKFFATNPHSINPPTYHEGKVLFQRGNHSSDSQLWCVDAATSETLWSSPFSAQWQRYEAPTVAEGKVWVNGGSYGGMYGYSLADGNQLFFHSLEQKDGWTPTYYNGKVYSWVNGNLREHDPTTGARLRELNIAPGYNALTCAIDGGLVYAMTNSSLVAIDINTFTKIWQQDILTNVTPAVSVGKVFVPIANEVMAYNSLTGVLQQTFTAPENLLADQPIIAQDKVIVSSATATYIFDLLSANLVRTIPAVGKLSLSGGTLFIADSQGWLHAWTVGQYNIELVNESAHGDVEFSKTVVDPGESVDVTVQADYGFVIEQILVNGTIHPMQNGNAESDEFTLSSIDSDKAIDVQFKYGPKASLDASTLSQGVGDVFKTNVFGKLGHSYILECCDNLEHWVEVGEAQPGMDGMLEFVHPPVDKPTFFFRIKEKIDP